MTTDGVFAEEESINAEQRLALERQKAADAAKEAGAGDVITPAITKDDGEESAKIEEEFVNRVVELLGDMEDYDYDQEQEAHGKEQADVDLKFRSVQMYVQLPVCSLNRSSGQHIARGSS